MLTTSGTGRGAIDTTTTPATEIEMAETTTETVALARTVSVSEAFLISLYDVEDNTFF